MLIRGCTVNRPTITRLLSLDYFHCARGQEIPCSYRSWSVITILTNPAKGHLFNISTTICTSFHKNITTAEACQESWQSNKVNRTYSEINHFLDWPQYDPTAIRINQINLLSAVIELQWILSSHLLFISKLQFLSLRSNFMWSEAVCCALCNSHFIRQWEFSNNSTRWNYRVFGLCPLSSILKPLHNTTFQKLDLFLSSNEEGDTYSVGSIRKN
jgi:hypothetical protein